MSPKRHVGKQTFLDIIPGFLNSWLPAKPQPPGSITLVFPSPTGTEAASKSQHDLSMKFAPLTLLAALFLTSCAGVGVVDTQTAAVVTKQPKAIYIRPFDVEGADFRGRHPGGPGELPLKKSLSPIAFANALKEEMELIAPAYVLQEDEAAPLGWLVEGTIDLVDAGNPWKRAVGPPQANPWGRSHIKIHVRISDLDRDGVRVEDKDGSINRRRGRVIYEFDVAGGSRASGIRGNITAPGFGYATPFDYRNAAERIRSAVEPDRHRYGARSSSTLP